MRTYRRTVATRLDPDEVFAYLADFGTTNEWDPRAGGTCLVAGEGASVGATYETDVRFLGRTTRMRYAITELDASSRRLVWVGRNSLVEATDRVVARAVPGGTEVDYTSTYDHQRAPALLDRLMTLPLARLMDEARDGLQQTLARHEGPRAA